MTGTDTIVGNTYELWDLFPQNPKRKTHHEEKPDFFNFGRFDWVQQGPTTVWLYYNLFGALRSDDWVILIAAALHN